MGLGAPDGARREELTRLVMAAQPAPFWLDRPDAPALREPLRGDAACDLAVIGGGFSGLWTALLAKEANPGRSVVLIEGNRIGWAASGRNGGFCEASLTHGADNGRERFPAEFGTLQRLGAENLDAIEAAIGRYGIDCAFGRAGAITVATEDYQVESLRAAAAADGGTFLDAAAVRAQVNSPTYLAGLWDGRVAYALGYTGLGVGATRFGARVMLDLLSGQRTELTQLKMVRSRPLPFPPEPLAYLGVQATRWSLARADRRSGRRNLWLRALDAAGMGYDS